MNPEVADDEAFRERFVRESRLAASVNHANVITVYDAGVWDDTLYIAMRYVPGGDLADRLREGPFAPDRALAILAQVAGGLDAAHAKGLIHRDVKPANVMIESDHGAEGPEIAYVTDFGLTKRVHTSARATASGEFLGTVDYVAPEQIEGRPVDHRVDIYSLGCMSYECLTGEPPFKRDNDAAVLWAHIQAPPPRVTDRRPELPAAVDDVIARAVAKDPEARYRNCSELVSALRDALERGAVRDAATTLLERPTVGGRSRGWSLPAGLALVAVGAALGALGAWATSALVDGDRPAAATVTVGRTITREAVPEPEAPDYIPEPFRETCASVEPPTVDFDASFACRPGEGVYVVRYHHAVSGISLSRYFRRRVERAGLTVSELGQRQPSIGSCSGPEFPAVQEWTPALTAGHEAVDRAKAGESGGRVLCTVAANGRARIEWTSNEPQVYAEASGGTMKRLYAWWQDEAGPLRRV